MSLKHKNSEIYEEMRQTLSKLQKTDKALERDRDMRQRNNTPTSSQSYVRDRSRSPLKSKDYRKEYTHRS